MYCVCEKAQKYNLNFMSERVTEIANSKYSFINIIIIAIIQFKSNVSEWSLSCNTVLRGFTVDIKSRWWSR